MSKADKIINRRRFIQTVGITGSIMLAGCQGNGGSNNAEGGGGKNENGIFNRTFHVPSETDWSNVNWNLFNPQTDTTPDQTSWWVYDTPARFKQGQNEWSPMIAEDFGIDGNTITLKLRDDYVWHNGDDLTAQDLVTQYRIDKYLEAPMWNFTEEVNASDDYTVEISVSNVNPDVAWPSFMDRMIYAKKSIYGKFLKELEQTDGSDEAINSLQEFQLDEPVGNGPFKMSETTNDAIIFERFEDYAAADNINWAKLKATFFPKETGMHQAAIGDQVDAVDHRQFPNNIVNQLPDHWDVIRVPAFEGSMMAFSPKGEFVGMDVDYGQTLRKAISYMFDAKQYKSLRAASTTVSPQCGLCNTAIEDYINDVAGDFEAYGPGPKIDKATQLLKGAGFQKNDGQWYTPDNKLVNIPFKMTGSWTSSHSVFGNVPEQLNNFGIQSESVIVEDSEFFGPVLTDNDFEMALAGNWGQVGFAHPYFNLQPCIGTVGEPAFWRPDIDKYEVPMPIGNANGNLQTINVTEKLRTLSKTSKKSKAKKIIKELAWTVNQVRPYMNSTEKRNQHFITRDMWSYPESGNGNLKTNIPFIHLAKTGEMKATN
ncbi:ABC transporter substrate-binding protein [Halocatena marina]|uniref:ABC transporter substrate-binding protein n=1 Tax=Halocatena marina TaxID=2934937 RepID=A0ABD5YVU8_9EURY|nr:ABC transporter substrate-binding protein [Halocatena marina]